MPAGVPVAYSSPVKSPAVYVMASKPRGTLYVGVTSDLVKHVWQHREGQFRGFTKRHGVTLLVWYEQHPTMIGAIGREKAIKRFRRSEKIALITFANPGWRDLWRDITRRGGSGHPDR